MKRLLIVVILSLFFASTAQSQTTEDSVKQTVNKMFTAMRTADAALFNTCFTDSAILQTIAKDKKSGEVKIRIIDTRRNDNCK